MTPKQKTLLRRVEEVLHYMWDPIGVAGAPEARDEYDSYALRVLGLLDRGGDADALAEYLAGAERDGMGLTPGPGRTRDVAALLIRWRDWIEEHR